MIQVRCPHCDAEMNLPHVAVGTTVVCNACKNRVTVPARKSGSFPPLALAPIRRRAFPKALVALAMLWVLLLVWAVAWGLWCKGAVSTAADSMQEAAAGATATVALLAGYLVVKALDTLIRDASRGRATG
jgi:hypothetical protein